VEKQPSFSGTNTHEAGVDEPDLVKTDGRRIVTVSRGVLRVIDPAGRLMTGRLDFAAGPDDQTRWAEATLLLHGDRALVLVPDVPIPAPAGPVTREPGPATSPTSRIAGPRLILVDLSGEPRILGEYRMDGRLVDARQVGSMARVVIRSMPRLTFPYAEDATDGERLATNRDVIDKASIDAWLPRYEVTDAGRTTSGLVDCEQVSRPATYSGTSIVTVLSFDLTTSRLGDGAPVTVVADGDTVYSNGPNLYVANDQRWRLLPALAASSTQPKPQDEVTDIFQFAASGPGRPRHVASASVPGWLVNQYAMSEWNGHLRVATTTGQVWKQNPKTSSSVYVLRADGKSLTETGRVTGLGKGERIYAVRFVADTGYVVTFRQTDPLYAVDLRDPAAPRVAGELKINGYSAYLHPLAAGRLLGIGQEASDQGRVQGTQVSLFDVTDLTNPTRLGRYHVRLGHSEAEFDPHAFLYWPPERLLVVPLTSYGQVRPDSTGKTAFPTTSALTLRVTDNGFAELGVISHPWPRGERAFDRQAIRRSLVVGDVLWTVSAAGLQATSISSMDPVGWVPAS
jgi:hypothetical protein